MEKQSFRTFLFILISQFFSLIGTSLTSFGLGVWVLKETGSVTMFSFIMMFGTVPAILVSPFAGVIVDRFSRKWIMVISDTMAALSTLVLFLLLTLDRLEIWHIFISAGVSSFFSAFQSPAFQSSVSLMVPKDQLSRANGMVQMIDAASFIIAPLLAGILILEIGIKGIILIDLTAFLIAQTILILSKIPEIRSKEEEKKKITFLKDALYGWKYITDRAGLKGLLVFFAVANLLLGYFNVLLQPYILSFANEKTLGAIISFSSIGALVGGVLTSTWGGPKKRITSVIMSGVLGGVFLSITGFRSSTYIVAIGTFLLFLIIPFANSASQAIWQSKVAANVQGRVFALRRMIAISLSPVAYVTAGPIVEYGFEPFIHGKSPIASLFQTIIGNGEGRGIGLFLILIGLLWSVSTILITLNPRVKNIESELPDEIDQPSSVQMT